MRAGPGRHQVKGPWRPDIEGLRALSIILVVGYHYAGAVVPGGFLGVDVFFVISGYLITLTLVGLQDSHGPTGAALFAFWARRARRLLPNAFVVLLAACGVGVFWLPAAGASRLGDEVAWAAGYAINWLFLDRAADYLRWGETESSALLNYWSLAVEEQFYLAWPAVLLVCLGAGHVQARRLRAALWITIALCVASFGAGLAMGESSLTLAFYASPLRAWELLAGAALALHVQANRPWPDALVRRAPRLAWISAAVLAASAFVFDHDTRHPGAATLVPVGATLVLIAAMGAAPAAMITRGLGSAAARALGARSYSIYLWHWPVWVLGSSLWPQAQVATRAPALLVLSLVLAEAAYRWIESPARWRWARSAPDGAVLAVAALTSVALVAGGLALGGRARAQGLSDPLRVHDRPSGLPPLARTLADLPVTYANGCHLEIEPDAPAPGCRLGGRPDGPSVVLLGDSHAAQWLPPLLQVASGRGVAVWAWTKSGCAFADVTIWNAEARAPYRECDRWRQAVQRDLAGLGSAAIFVSNQMDDSTVVVERASGKLLRGAAAAAAFDAGLARSLGRLRETGQRVIVIRDTPRARSDVLGCLYSRADARACERRREDALPAVARDLVVAEATGVTAWDFTDRICGPKTCPVLMEQERRSVYRDPGHLSASFAVTLAPALEARWKATAGLP
jgi:peptidoglycan/LPS O-acetylase OafA/YrhL